MLKAGEKFYKRESLAKVIESHGIDVGRKAKLINKHSGGNGVLFKCDSMDENTMECECAFSVYFSKSRKKCDNIKLYDMDGKVIDNSVWIIPLKSKLCTTHTCLTEETTTANGTEILCIEDASKAMDWKIDWKMEWNVDLQSLSSKIGGKHFDGNNVDHPNLFTPFVCPKLNLTFEPPEQAPPGKYDHFHNKNKSNRTAKLIRCTRQAPTPRPMADGCDIKSELEIWLDELSAHYATLTVNTPKKETKPEEDPLIVAYYKEIEEVKLAIRAKFADKLFVFDESKVQVEKSGKNSNFWNLECDIASWKCNSIWWHLCTNNYIEDSRGYWLRRNNIYNKFRI